MRYQMTMGIRGTNTVRLIAPPMIRHIWEERPRTGSRGRVPSLAKDGASLDRDRGVRAPGGIMILPKKPNPPKRCRAHTQLRSLASFCSQRIPQRYQFPGRFSQGRPPAAGSTSQPDRARAPTAFPSERDAGSPHQSVRFCVSARHSPLVYFSLRNPHSKAVCAQCASNRPCRRIHSLRYHQHHARDPRPSRGALGHTESSSCVSAHSQTVKYRLCTEGKKV